MGSLSSSILSKHSRASLGEKFVFFWKKRRPSKRLSSTTRSGVEEGGVVENQPSKPLLKLSTQPFEGTLLEKVTCFL